MTKLDLRVNIGGLSLQNPVITASGTYGFGREYGEFYDIRGLGAITTKGITLEPRGGNSPPRITETPSGIINSVGLENPGMEAFMEEELPRLEQLDMPFIVNISGDSVEDYVHLARKLKGSKASAIEVNVSCPNVKQGGLHFGTQPRSIYKVTKEVRKAWDGTLIIKLSPNVTDICEIARSAQEAGADALSMINTIKAMDIDIYTRKSMLGNRKGGLSGPAVLPVALRMVYETAEAVDIPIIGMGGIMTGEDGIKFLLAGASAISIGTGNFIDPMAPLRVLEGIKNYMRDHGFQRLEQLVGKLQ